MEMKDGGGGWTERYPRTSMTPDQPPPPRYRRARWFLHLSVSCFKSNDQKPTVNHPFTPQEGAQLKLPQRYFTSSTPPTLNRRT